jgi:hypothetical protein
MGSVKVRASQTERIRNQKDSRREWHKTDPAAPQAFNVV